MRLAENCYCLNFGSFANNAADTIIKAAAVNKDAVYVPVASRTAPRMTGLRPVAIKKVEYCLP